MNIEKKRAQKKAILSPEQIKSLEQMCAFRMNQRDIAAILGISETTLQRLLKYSQPAREAADRGRAKGSLKAYSTAFQLATGHEVEKEVVKYNAHRGRYETVKVMEKVPPDSNMLRFWLQTQEGWRRTDKIELSGPGGGPIAIEEMTPEQREKRIDHLLKIRARIQALEDSPVIDVTPKQEVVDGSQATDEEG